MQYKTQCSTTRDVITTSLPSNNYLLSQIVKEQPIDASEEAPINLASSATLIADSSWFLPPCAFRLASSFSGGANRDRTGDLLLAKQALSQLSYGPWGLGWFGGGSGWIRTIDPRLIKTVL